MNSTQVTYQTPTGANATGYIIDGRTYKDKEGKERIDIGSVVPTAGGTYLYTGIGGVQTPGSTANDLANAYAAVGQNLTNSLAAKKNAINAATQNRLYNIAANRKYAHDRYGQANRQAYQTYLSASNPYGAAGEQRAKLGLADSGYAESSQMKIANTYQTAVAENQRQKQAYLDELENAYREAKYQGDIETANAIAEYEMLVYRHGIDAAEAIAAQQNRAYDAGVAANNEMWARNMDEREFEAARSDELWRRAYQLATKGLSNADIARSLGISEDALTRIILEKFA